MWRFTNVKQYGQNTKTIAGVGCQTLVDSQYVDPTNPFRPHQNPTFLILDWTLNKYQLLYVIWLMSHTSYLYMRSLWLVKPSLIAGLDPIQTKMY